jgi:predicted amidohydrolase
MIFNLAVIQYRVGFDKDENLKKAEKFIKEGVESGAEIVLLPEMFNCPYSVKYIPQYAEPFPHGTTFEFLAEQAKKNSVYLVGGSHPEKEGDNIFNTCFVFGPDGKLLGKHRKVHLFDINVEGGISFKESDTFTSGDEFAIIDTELGKIGIVICYDMRFPEIFRIMTLRGVKMVLIPAAFNITTGPAHWELLSRTRAVDNQIFLAAASPAQDDGGVYQAWGHSMIVDPWGRILKNAGTGDKVILSKIDYRILEKVRSEMPLLKHIRKDLYEIQQYKNHNNS